MRWSLLLLLSVLCFSTWSCNQVGKSLAGGEGNRGLFGQVPPVPSPPVVLNTYVMVGTDIKTNPEGPLPNPERFDRFAAIGDTKTIIISAGPASYLLNVQGAYLDPRIDDSILLRDRGNNLWLGESGFGQFAYSVQLRTDNAGVPQTYEYQLVSKSVNSDDIATDRTFSFGQSLPNTPPDSGLWVGRVSGTLAPPPNVGDCFNMILNSFGLVQWEQYNFQHDSRVIPGPVYEAQHTGYDTSRNPPNLEYVSDLYPLPLVLLSNMSDCVETEHYGHVAARAFTMYPPPFPGTYPVNQDTSPPHTWYGKSVLDPGDFYYPGAPYYLTNLPAAGPNISFQIIDDALLMNITAGGIYDPATNTQLNGVTHGFHIIRLTHDIMTAVYSIDLYNYELATLFRDVGVGSLFLTNHAGDSCVSANLSVQRFGITGTGPDQLLGTYQVGTTNGEPLHWH